MLQKLSVLTLAMAASAVAADLPAVSIKVSLHALGANRFCE